MIMAAIFPGNGCQQKTCINLPVSAEKRGYSISTCIWKLYWQPKHEITSVDKAKRRFHSAVDSPFLLATVSSEVASQVAAHGYTKERVKS